MTEKQSYSLADIAKRWGRSHSHVLNLVRSGKLPAIDTSTNPAGRSSYSVPVEFLEAFEAGRVTRPPTPTPKRSRRKRWGSVKDYFK